MARVLKAKVKVAEKRVVEFGKQLHLYKARLDGVSLQHHLLFHNFHSKPCFRVLVACGYQEREDEQVASIVVSLLQRSSLAQDTIFGPAHSKKQKFHLPFFGGANFQIQAWTLPNAPRPISFSTSKCRRSISSGSGGGPAPSSLKQFPMLELPWFRAGLPYRRRDKLFKSREVLQPGRGLNSDRTWTRSTMESLRAICYFVLSSKL